MDKPLPIILRPTTIKDIIGQTHLLNDENGVNLSYVKTKISNINNFLW